MPRAKLPEVDTYDIFTKDDKFARAIHSKQLRLNLRNLGAKLTFEETQRKVLLLGRELTTKRDLHIVVDYPNAEDRKHLSALLDEVHKAVNKKFAYIGATKIIYRIQEEDV